MLRPEHSSVIILTSLFLLCSCIDLYSPKLKGYESVLVVDGLITNENASFIIKLSRTIQEQNGSPEVVSGANVFISDDSGNVSRLYQKGGGIYKTDSIEFKGVPGRTYVLHIITGEDDEYKSEPCLMQTVPDIDSIYFAKDQELVNNQTESQMGIRIYLDSEERDSSIYYRWGFEETWKFKVSMPGRFDYYGMYNIVPAPRVKEYCWKSTISDEVLIHQVLAGEGGSVRKEPILFIAPDKSDRLMLQYSILIKQYSISKDEFDFWKNIKRVDESGGDIFATQPFAVISNIHNINNPKEKVLGYFQVSAVKQKRIFIPFSEVVRLHLPFFHNLQCERLEKSPEEYASPFGPPMTFDKLYEMFCITSGYAFVEPLYNSQTNKLEKLVFTKPECADCELTGSNKKPNYWTDLN